MKTYNDRFVIRWPHEGHKHPFDKKSGNAWLEDTANGECIFTDGGEPEDQILCRDLKDIVDSLNGVDAQARAADAPRIAAVRMALGVSEGDDLDALLGELLMRHAAALEALATVEDVLEHGAFFDVDIWDALAAIRKVKP